MATNTTTNNYTYGKSDSEVAFEMAKYIWTNLDILNTPQLAETFLTLYERCHQDISRRKLSNTDLDG